MFIILIISVSVLVTLASALAACICGCKNSNPKSELVGTAGVLKLHYDEEAPSPTPTTPASIKRASTQNSQRSLPEIPHAVGRHDSGDTASEIYATVNVTEVKNLATASTSRDHPYEHAYAKLQNENHVVVEIPQERAEQDIPIDEREVSQSGPESIVISASGAISGQVPSSQELPYITPLTRNDHNAQHFSGDSTDSAKGYTSISVREPLSNIRAQSTKLSSQPHYATVSDDSDEMYAAIEEQSVGGGSDTYAQIAVPLTPTPSHSVVTAHIEPAPSRRSVPPEVAAAVIVNHSRQASSSSNTNSGVGSPKPEKRQANSPLPPPPAIDPRYHNRINSTGDLHASHDKLRRSLNEKHQRNNSCVSSSDFYGCNYPVEKHRFSSGDITRPLVAKQLNFDIDKPEKNADNLYNSIEGPGCSDYSSADANTSINSEKNDSPPKNLEDMYAKVFKKKSRQEEKRKSKETIEDESNVGSLKYTADDPGYETIDRKKVSNTHGYETITHKDRKTIPDPGYETVKDIKKSNPIYSNNNVLGINNADSGPNSIISSDPGYEHISKADNSASDSDPNYEVLRNQPPTPPYATIASNYNQQATYSSINKKEQFNWQRNNNEEVLLEPNYESMPNEPLYTTGSESDPNYESVRPKDPNYETLSTQDSNYESLRCKDPKYESVRSKDSKFSKKDPNYESVKYFDVDPTYEKVKNEGATGIDRSDSTGGYERINVPNNDNRNSINTETVVSDYFQV